jgi:DNA-binding response OmpR family regulator
MSKLLLVEDDIALANNLQQALSAEGWHVETAHTGKDGMQLLKNFKYDMILLDWNLPDIEGIDICRSFRADGGTTPIIFLTGNHELDYIEKGLDNGADDYVTKPFEIRELMARIRSTQRRSSNQASAMLTIGEVKLDRKLRVLHCGKELVKLTSMESDLIEFLMRNPDQTFSSAELFSSVWASDSNSDETTVRVHVRVLRRKLGIAGQPEFIKTILGKGYLIESK